MPVKSPTKAKNSLAEITSKQKQDFERFDQILFELVESGESPSYEHFLYASQLGIDAVALKAQLRRVSQAAIKMQVAGRPEDRNNLEQEAVDAEKVLATKGEQLLAQIAEDQKTYNSLESKARQLRRRHNEALEAVEALKTLVPDLTRQEYSLRKKMLQESIGSEINERQTQVKYLELLLNQTDYTDQAWLETVRLNNHEYVGYSGDRVQRRILLPAFEQAKPKLQQELNEIRSELEQLQKQFDAERKSMDESLEIYSK
jgi:hypothetical protein